MYNEAEEGDQMGDVTAQANGMAIDEMNDEEDFGNDSEMLGQD
jgi:F-box and leucine-rich repeat protein GRR1